LRISSATTFTQNDGCRNAQSARRVADTQNFHVRFCHSGGGVIAATSVAAEAVGSAIQHPFHLQSPVAPAVYHGEEASEHVPIYNCDCPYLNSLVVLVESTTRHVT